MKDPQNDLHYKCILDRKYVVNNNEQPKRHITLEQENHTVQYETKKHLVTQPFLVELCYRK